MNSQNYDNDLPGVRINRSFPLWKCNAIDGGGIGGRRRKGGGWGAPRIGVPRKEWEVRGGDGGGAPPAEHA